MEDKVVTGYAIILGVALCARVILSFLEFDFITPGQRMMWSWPVFGVFLLTFAAATLLAERARLPAPSETLESRFALGLAAVLGAIIGLLTIGSDCMSPAAAARGLPALHVTGIASVPFYLYGAILLTVLFHFAPMAATGWLAQQLPDSVRRAVVAAGVLLVAFSEDFSYFLHGPGLVTMETGGHGLSVLANATEAWLIYRYGLLAGLLQRATTYVLWHIVWPNLGPSP